MIARRVKVQVGTSALGANAHVDVLTLALFGDRTELDSEGSDTIQRLPERSRARCSKCNAAMLDRAIHSLIHEGQTVSITKFEDKVAVIITYARILLFITKYEYL